MGTDFELDLLGVRPCMGNVDEAAQSAHLEKCVRIIEKTTGETSELRSGSTDANSPLFLGILSAVFGLYRGDGAHTRGEWVELSSLKVGLYCALCLILQPK